ncbi:DUF4917 family protein [Photobacterium sp. 53610]|uniref:DUF4917 family protein n=1 Tax=Photobacterium sp. 53610 TaxID=3102789 RepID=UPI002ED7A1A0
MPYEIINWLDISEQFQDTVLLGNGASIAIDNVFDYGSLRQHAIDNGLLIQEVQQLFDYFDTNDFELILRLVWQSNRVNLALNIVDDETRHAYEHVRNCLIQAVRSIHPEYNEVEDQFDNISGFLSPFRTVLSLNYDLSLYWVIMKSNREANGHTFKDCFIDGEFDEDWQRFREPFGRIEQRNTLIFYPHGSLVLARDVLENEVKLEARGHDLLRSIQREWESSNFIPLFVSEGTSRQKIKSIQNSHYLNTVYREVLPNSGESLTIYGWGLGEHDIHILNRLSRSNINRVAVSVFGNNQAYCNRVHQMIMDYLGNHVDVVFFNCLSPGAWNQNI